MSHRERHHKKVSGIYAIEGPRGVYVGESADCWGRDTLRLAVMLGLECGIIREMPGADRLWRIRGERAVAQMFERRGFKVLSGYLQYVWPAQYQQRRFPGKVGVR